MKRFAILFVLALLAGCHDPKQLTADSAKSMLQEHFDEVPDQSNIPVQLFTKTLFKTDTTVDYRQSPTSGTDVPSMVHRLLDSGYVTQRAVGQQYVDVTGHYEGDAKNYSGLWHYKISLAMHQGSRDITGEWADTLHDHTGPLKGSGLSDGNIQLMFLLQTFNGMPNYSNNLVYRLNMEGGSLFLDGPMPHDQSVPIRLRKAEPLNVEKIVVPTYAYAFTSKAMVKTINGVDYVSMGKIEIVSVDSLLLATDTTATAQFNWKLDLNEIGRAMAMGALVEKKGSVQFGKQPDGIWVITSANIGG